jgi:hypothetical protein
MSATPSRTMPVPKFHKIDTWPRFLQFLAYLRTNPEMTIYYESEELDQLPEDLRNMHSEIFVMSLEKYPDVVMSKRNWKKVGNSWHAVNSWMTGRKNEGHMFNLHYAITPVMMQAPCGKTLHVNAVSCDALKIDVPQQKK